MLCTILLYTQINLNIAQSVQYINSLTILIIFLMIIDCIVIMCNIKFNQNLKTNQPTSQIGNRSKPICSYR